MRIYRNFKETFNEIARDLKEMGIRVKTKSVQDIQSEEGFNTFELQNYQYLVTDPKLEDIPVKDVEWREAEFLERISPKYLNPGKAWELRKEYWLPFLHHGVFSYTYNETMAWWIELVVNELKRDLNTRRAFIPIFSDGRDSYNLEENQRVPCSIGYFFYFRQGTLNITYLQRSSDFITHFSNDVWLAVKLLRHICPALVVFPGTFSHWLGSLHVFKKDVENVF
jgi:thymidylate synthase